MFWYCRSHCQAIDFPYCSPKEQIRFHLNDWKISPLLIPELGWYHPYPALATKLPGRREAPADSGEIEPLRNWCAKITDWDDIEAGGAASVIHGAGFSLVELEKGVAAQAPVYQRFIDRLKTFRSLRDGDVLSREARENAKKSGAFYRLIEKNGRYGLAAVDRLLLRPRGLREGENECLAVNAYARQKPVIRLEGRRTAAPYDDARAVLAARFDKDRQIEPDAVIRFEAPLSICCKEALGLWVCGNDTEGALRLRLESAGYSPNDYAIGFADYFITLNFSGWKYFTLAELHNADYPEYEFPDCFEDENRNAIWRWNQIYRGIFVSYAKLSSLRVTILGDATGVRLGDVHALPVVETPVLNPGVEVNGRRIQFSAALEPVSYIEYTPETGEAFVYDIYGNGKPCGVTGEAPILETGENMVKVFGDADGYMRMVGHMIATDGKVLY
jgi:hypothetical protein